MTHELLRPMHPKTIAQNGVLSRVASAFARPWQTCYVAPRIKTAEALIYALRGYDVEWSTPTYDPIERERNPSTLSYAVYEDRDGERWRSHGVETSMVFPAWMHKAECWVRNARNCGWPWIRHDLARRMTRVPRKQNARGVQDKSEGGGP